MKFKYTILYVNNVEASLNFYQNAFGFEVKMLHESKTYGEMQSGETVLAFGDQSATEQFKPFYNGSHDSTNMPKFEIAFECDDVSAAVDKAVAAGAKLLLPVEEKPWGQTVAYVQDLDGNLVELCSAIF